MLIRKCIISRSSLFSERWYPLRELPLPRPSKKPETLDVRDLLAFLGYLELCVHIFRRDLSAPETHESGSTPVFIFSISYGYKASFVPNRRQAKIDIWVQSYLCTQTPTSQNCHIGTKLFLPQHTEGVESAQENTIYHVGRILLCISERFCTTIFYFHT